MPLVRVSNGGSFEIENIPAGYYFRRDGTIANTFPMSGTSHYQLAFINCEGLHGYLRTTSTVTPQWYVYGIKDGIMSVATENRNDSVDTDLYDYLMVNLVSHDSRATMTLTFTPKT